MFAFDCVNPGSLADDGYDCQGGPNSLTVELTAEGGAPVTGKVARFGPETIFVPSEPLTALTAYEVHALLLKETDETDGGPGAEVSFTFTTGASLIAPPQLDAPAERVFETYEAPVTVCDDDVRLVGVTAQDAMGPAGCGQEAFTGCEDAGSATTARLRLELGPVHGELDSFGYDVQVALTDNAPGPYLDYGPAPADTTPPGSHELNLPGVDHVAAGETWSFAWDLPRTLDGGATVLCLRARVVDAAGQFVEFHAECLPLAEAQLAAKPLGSEADDTPAQDDDVAPQDDDVMPEAVEKQAGKGCSTGHGPRSFTFAWLLALLLVVVRSRGRQRATASSSTVR